jgi:hypothetical protein
MNELKLNRLKEVLSIQTHSREEDLMIAYLEDVLTQKGYNHYKDSIGNVYVTKGEAEFYPCFVSHTDTVHQINHNMKVVELEENGKKILTGIDMKTMNPSGIGGDDKCGVYLCLEMLDKLDNVKAAFFVSEEIGCIGSRQADPEFFKNVGYAIQYDSPKGNSMSMSLMGIDLFGKDTNFGEKVSPLILEHGITDWASHPYTDIWPLMEKFGFSCLNLAAGYYNYHTNTEYVIVDDVTNAFELGLKLHEELGENFYERPKKKNVFNSLFGGSQYSRGQKLLNEYEDDVYEEDDSLYFEDEDEDDEKDIIDITTQTVDGFEDQWDYDDFNGGYSIKNYSDDYNDDTRFDW